MAPINKINAQKAPLSSVYIFEVTQMTSIVWQPSAETKHDLLATARSLIWRTINKVNLITHMLSGGDRLYGVSDLMAGFREPPLGQCFPVSNLCPFFDVAQAYVTAYVLCLTRVVSICAILFKSFR